MEVVVLLLVAVLVSGLVLMSVVREKRRKISRVKEIHKLGDLENIQDALELLQAPSHSEITSFREAAGRGLAQVHARLVSLGQSDIDQLIQLSNDQRLDVRRVATKALGEINSSKAVESLIKRLIDDNRDMRREAATALAKLGETAKGFLFSALKHTNPAIRRAAADVLRDIGVPNSNPLLIEYRQRVAEEKQTQEDFQRSIDERTLRDERRKRAEMAARISSLTDEEMIDVLVSLCNAYTENDRDQVKALESLATNIGKELSYRGGLNEMRRIFYRLNGMRGSRTLEMHWGGIGSWQG